MNNLVIQEKTKREKVRELVVDKWLKRMVRTDPSLCPLDMNSITYECVAYYMAQKQTKKAKLHSKGHYSSIRSAIMHLFTMSSTLPPPTFREKSLCF